MKNTSKPYSTGYYSYATNYVKNFGLYPFTEEQKLHLLSLKTKEDTDGYINHLWGCNIEDKYTELRSYHNSLSFAFAEILGRNFGGGCLELMPNGMKLMSNTVFLKNCST